MLNVSMHGDVTGDFFLLRDTRTHIRSSYAPFFRPGLTVEHPNSDMRSSMYRNVYFTND